MIQRKTLQQWLPIAAVLVIAIFLTVAYGGRPAVQSITPEPPTVTPAPPTPVPATFTPLPLPPTSTPEPPTQEPPTVTPVPPPATVPPTPGMDADTKGDAPSVTPVAPVIAPRTGGQPDNVDLFRDTLLAIAGGALTYKLADWLFNELRLQGIKFTKRRKRLAVYIVSFGITALGFAADVYFGYLEANAPNAFVACLGAFATSQALHMAYGLNDIPDDEPDAPAPAQNKSG